MAEPESLVLQLLGRRLIIGGHFDAREFGDQIFSVVAKETVRFSRNERNNLARIRRACGGMRGQNCLITASGLDGRQGGEPIAVIFGP